MSDYKYKCPTTYGYKKIKLSQKEHNQYFGKKRWCEKYEYYIKDNHIKVHVFINKLGIATTLIISPIFMISLSICYRTWGGFKEVLGEISDLLNQKQKGMFYAMHYNIKGKTS